MPLGDIDGLAVARFVVALRGCGVGEKRTSNILVCLRACLRWHHRMGSMRADPSGWFDRSAVAADERRILTIDEVERLVEATPVPYRAFVMTAAYTGMRSGELRALTWADIDFEARTATVNKTLYRTRHQRSTKTGLDRVVPIPPHVVEALERSRGDAPVCAQVFKNSRGRPIDADDFRRRVFKPAVARARLDPDLRFHDLRHTSASLHLRHGATVREVMAIHGWSQLQTAMRYLHTMDGLARSAERLSTARAAANRHHTTPASPAAIDTYSAG